MTGKEYQELLQLYKEYKIVNEELNYYETVFVDKEDLDAIKVIRDEINRIIDINGKLEKRIDELQYKLYGDCTHEVATALDRSDYPCCAICGGQYYEVKPKYLFIVDDYDIEDVIRSTVIDYVIKEKKFDESFVDEVFKNDEVKMRARIYRGEYEKR